MAASEPLRGFDTKAISLHKALDSLQFVFFKRPSSRRAPANFEEFFVYFLSASKTAFWSSRIMSRQKWPLTASNWGSEQCLALFSLRFCSFFKLWRIFVNFCFCFDFESDVSKVTHDQQVFQAVILKSQNFQWNERFSSFFHTNMNKLYYLSN